MWERKSSCTRDEESLYQQNGILMERINALGHFSAYKVGEAYQAKFCIQVNRFRNEEMPYGSYLTLLSL